MILVLLTKGKVARIDEQDFNLVSQFNWTFGGTGYATAYGGGGRKNRKQMYLHRLILGAEPGVQVDHKNGDRLDNRRANLRLCSNSENQMNRKPRQGRATKYKGVRKTKEGRWNARITVNGKVHHLGNYDTDEEAAKAYNKAAIEFYGEFARLNEVA